MSESIEKKPHVASKETIHEIRKVAEEKLGELSDTVMNLIDKRDQYIEDSTLLSLGVAFILGLAFGVAITKRKE